MIHLLRVTAFNLPRLTRSSGAVLALLLCAIYAWLFADLHAPVYVKGLFLAASVAAFAAAGSLACGFRKLGWGIASAVAVLGVLGYVVSRTAGLPGFASAVGAWQEPLGTVALLLDVAVVAVYASVLLGVNVDTVGARDWDTYYSR